MTVAGKPAPCVWTLETYGADWFVRATLESIALMLAAGDYASAHAEVQTLPLTPELRYTTRDVRLAMNAAAGVAS